MKEGTAAGADIYQQRMRIELSFRDDKPSRAWKVMHKWERWTQQSLALLMLAIAVFKLVIAPKVKYSV